MASTSSSYKFSKKSIISLIVIVAVSVGLTVTLQMMQQSQDLGTEAKGGIQNLTMNPMVDMNRDGIVNTADLEVWKEIYTMVKNGGWSYAFYVADLNHDGKIDVLDMTGIGARAGQTITRCNWADVDGNGKVNKKDLDMFREAFNNNPEQINQYTNRYDINNDSLLNIVDISGASTEYGKKCE